MTSPTHHPSHTKGQLLVATPPLADPNFDRTVVYMLEHRPDGALGLVLNRPEVPLTGHHDADADDDLDTGDPGDAAAFAFGGLDAWAHLLAPPALLFRGGPVGEASLIAIAEGSAPDGSVWGAIDDRIGAVDLAGDPDEAPAALERLRVFRGYSGWGPGQLESELRAGAWMVFDAEPGDVFTAHPDELWRLVLRRQGGRLAWIADAPDDITAN